jgi:hypothetical protein
VVVAPASARGDDSVPPIETDRPDFTETATVVPLRSLQIEGGLTAARLRDESTLSGPETLLRYGLAPRFELRLGVPDSNLAWGGGARRSGLGDTYLGAKAQIGPLGRTDLAFIGAAIVPTGSREFSSGTWYPQAAVSASHPLGEEADLGGQLTFSFPRENGGRRTALDATLVLGREVGPRWGVFAEYAGTYTQGGPPEHILHAGTAYSASPTLQFDLHFGLGLNRNAPDFLIGAGFGVRLDPRPASR